MADLSDVTAYLKGQAVAAVYPNGAAQPSVASMDVRLMEGWPIAAQLDLDLAGKMKDASNNTVPRANGPLANVSIFPMAGAGKTVYQILDQEYVIQPAVITSTAVLNGTTITVTGALSSGEFLTLIIDDAVICSQTGTNVVAMLAALAAQAVGFGYAATSTATTLTVPFGHSMVMRQGGAGIKGKVIHRQCNSVMVTVWAPDPTTRATLAKAIDNLIKQTNRVTMPDTSQALVIYSRTNTIDEHQADTVYRRDLIYDVEYATVEQFAAYTITSTQVSVINAANTNTIAIAVT